jgi:hypothetical protein
MTIPTILQPVGSSITGKVSWFGGPHDSSDSGHTASGIPETQPGIAVYNRATLGGWWRVIFPNGRTLDLQQTDLGPAPWTGRNVDILYSALAGAGYTETNFPTDSTVTATYLGQRRPTSNTQTTSTSPSAAGAASGGSQIPPTSTTGGGGSSGSSGSWFDTLIKWATYLAFIGGGAVLVWYGTKTVMQPRQAGPQ